MRNAVRGDWKPDPCATLRTGSKTTASSGRCSSGAWTTYCMTCKPATPRLRTTRSKKRRMPVKRRSEMKNSKTFNITAHSEREIVVTRVFDAPRRLVFDAYTKPELIKRWLLGPDGWSMPICEIDLRAGGKYRYVWRSDTNGHEMGMGGTYREVVPPERIVVTEVFDEAWYPGEAVDTIILTQQGGKTTLTQTILYNSRETRDAVLKSPMQTGMAASYDRLENFLPSSGPEALSA